MGGGRRKKKEKKKKKKANAKLPTKTKRARERERVICVRQNVSALVWETCWCGTSTKFLNFLFFYNYLQVNLRCVGMKIRIFFIPFYFLR